MAFLVIYQGEWGKKPNCNAICKNEQRYTTKSKVALATLKSCSYSSIFILNSMLGNIIFWFSNREHKGQEDSTSTYEVNVYEHLMFYAALKSWVFLGFF